MAAECAFTQSALQKYHRSFLVQKYLKVDFIRATDLFVYNISLRPGAEAASEGEQPGLVDCTLYFVIRIGLFAYRVRLFSARVGLFFVGGGLFFG